MRSKTKRGALIAAALRAARFDAHIPIPPRQDQRPQRTPRRAYAYAPSKPNGENCP